MANPHLDSTPHTPRLSRRGFLRGVAGGGAAIALARWLPGGSAAAQAGAGGGSSGAFTPKELATLRAAAEALLMDVPVDPSGVAATMDREVALMGEPIVTDFKTVLGLLEHLTILGGRLTRFTRLSPEARLAYLEGWGTSRFNLRRAAYHAVRTLVHFYGWADASTRPITGYTGTWPETRNLPAYPVDFGEIA